MAESILAEYEDRIPGGVTLVPGHDGIFAVHLGQQRLFSKQQTGRFPREGEIEDALAPLLGG